MKEKKDGSTRRHGIYVLPSLLTMMALFAGFFAIVAGMKQHFDQAATAIIVAIIFDGLDGRIARLTGTQSAFGAELDSLSDMVSFGVAPALVLYVWSLSSLGKPGWLAAFLYTACTALRLARFNTAPDADKRYFQGLSTTLAAALSASFVWSLSLRHVDAHAYAWPIFALTLLIAALKVTTLPYRSFKEFSARGRISFLFMAFLAFLFVAIAVDPADILLAMSAAYVASGPVLWLWRCLKEKRHARKKGHLHVLSKKKEGSASSKHHHDTHEK